jgi:hypothetical protein
VPVSKHYDGHGAKVMRAMKKTYGDSDTAKRVFYATENKKKSQSQKKSRKRSGK